VEVRTGLFAHERQFVAREVIVRNVVVAPATRQDAAPETLPPRVPRVSETTSNRVEIRDGQHHPSGRPGDTRHFPEGEIRRIEVVDCPLADHRVETARREGQGIRPTPQLEGGGIGRFGIQLPG